MEKKNINLSIATITFVIGAFFVLANTKDITGAIVGASGPGGTLTIINRIATSNCISRILCFNN